MVSAATWHIPPAMTWLKHTLLSSPPADASMIKRGLGWRCTVKVPLFNPGEIAEILGWIRNGPMWLVNVQRWTKRDKVSFLPRLPLYGAGTDIKLDADLILKSLFPWRITRVFKEMLHLGIKLSKGYLQLVPNFPSANPRPRRGWIRG